MKIQVFGENGMLGREVVAAAVRAGHECIPTTVLGRQLGVYAPRLGMVYSDFIVGDVVINCAGIVKQRSATKAEIVMSNSYGPHNLAQACQVKGVRLIHVSTDCVFSGPGPHGEYYPTNPADFYGVSKLAGEVDYGPHLTVRTSFVGFGQYGLLRDLMTQKKVSASENFLWSGHTAKEVAKTLIVLAERHQCVGLLHMPGEFQNRYQLVNKLIKKFGLETEVILDNDYAADRRLVSLIWNSLHLPKILPFDQQLEEMDE